MNLKISAKIIQLREVLDPDLHQFRKLEFQTHCECQQNTRIQCSELQTGSQNS